MLGLIGPNGAGKTTLVNVLSGFQRPARRRDPRRRDRLHAAPAPRLSARRDRPHLPGGAPLQGADGQRERRDRLCRARARPRRGAAAGGRNPRRARASPRKAEPAASGLSYGEERRVGLARALAVNPRFLLLDEPAAGLAPAEAEELRHLIGELRAKYDCGVLVIEHNMALVMNLCERIHVLDGGRTIAAGTPAEIRADAERPARLSRLDRPAMSGARRSSRVSGLVVRYGAIAAVRGVDLDVARGRDRRHRRTERRRQDLAPLGHRRHRPPGCRQRSPSPAGRSTELTLEDVVGARHRAGAGGPAHLREPHRGARTCCSARRSGATRTACAPTSSASSRRSRSSASGARQPAGQLSGGEQQQLAIARALLSRPRLLMLDEPSLGLAPAIVDQVYVLLRAIRDDGVTILLVEQNAERAFALADRAHVMSGGVFGCSGTPAELRARSGLRRRLFRHPHGRPAAAPDGPARPDARRRDQRRRPLRADRARHRPDLRRHAADQLRPWRADHGRPATRSSRSSASRSR